MPNRLWSERFMVGFTVFLVLAGVVMVYSASSIMAEKRFHDSLFFLKRHIIYAALGFSLMAAAARFDYRHMRRLALPLLAVSYLLLILVLVPGVGSEAGGATRWLRLGPLSMQPSELAKLALICFFAHSFTKKGEIVEFRRGFLPYMVILLAFLVPMLLQPDFGSAMTLLGIVFVMLFAGGARVTHLGASSMVVAAGALVLVSGAEYRRRRILSFLDPWSDPQDTGFQIIQSFIAFGSGGMTGRGLGEGRQKLFYLPEPHTDFVLPVIGEEIGFVGLLVIILLFAGLVILGIRAALKAEDAFGCHLAMGLTALIALQAIVNMGVVMGLLPTKGLPLPFISYGGTALLVNMVAAGLLISITARGKG